MQPPALPPQQAPQKQRSLQARDRSLVKKIVVAGCITQFIIWVAAMSALGSDSTSTSTDIAPTPSTSRGSQPAPATTTAPAPSPTTTPALDAEKGSVLWILANDLEVRDRDRVGYKRYKFGQAWADVDRNGCDQRNDVLRRDMVNLHTKPGTNGCALARGTLSLEGDSYAAKRVRFKRGNGKVEIDHVVSLADAWRAGAYAWDVDQREEFANDFMNLEALDSETNQDKNDETAAGWLPDDDDDQCALVVRQITIKHRYELSITPAEQQAMQQVLTSPVCDGGDIKPQKVKEFKAPKAKPIGEPKPKPKPEPKSDPTPDREPYYRNCAAVRAAGAAPIYRGEPGYARHLDRDGDGVGCES
jgi:Excalibur calcium-binding domain/Protein of unknown function (DUF1524)